MFKGLLQTKIPGIKKCEQEQTLTLQTVAEECHWAINLRHDADKIEEKHCSQVQKISRLNPYYGYGGLHFKNSCPFKNIKCFKFDQIGQVAL